MGWYIYYVLGDCINCDGLVLDVYCKNVNVCIVVYGVELLN